MDIFTFENTKMRMLSFLKFITFSVELRSNNCTNVFANNQVLSDTIFCLKITSATKIFFAMN